MKNTFLLLFALLAFQFSSAQMEPTAITPAAASQQETLKKIHSSVQTNKVPANASESNATKVNTSARATQNSATTVMPTTPYGSAIDASGNVNQITPSTTTSPTTTGSNKSAGNMSSENVTPSGPPTPVTRDSSPRP